MAIQLEPVELDISEALNDIDTLKERIEDAFESHGESDDPRVEKILQQMRNVYNTLEDVQERMDEIHFDPNIGDVLINVSNQIQSINEQIDSSREHIAELETQMNDVSFNQNIENDIVDINSAIDTTRQLLDSSTEHFKSLESQLQNININPNLEKDLSTVENELDRTSEEVNQLRDQLFDIGAGLADYFNFDFDTKGLNYLQYYLEDIQELAEQNDGSAISQMAQAYLEVSQSVSELDEEYKILFEDRRALIEQSEHQERISEQYEEEKNSIQALGEELDSLTQQKENLQQQSEKQSTIVESYEQERQSVEQLESSLSDLQEQEQALQKQQNQQESISNEYQKAADSATVLGHRLDGVTNSTKKAQTEATKLKGIFGSISDVFKGLYQALGSISNVASNIGSKIDGVLKNMASRMMSVHKSTAQASLSFGKMLTRAVGLMIGVQGVWSILNKLRSVIIQNMQYAISGVSSLKTAFDSLKLQLTTIKVQMAAAFLPLIEVALPAIKSVVSALSEAVNMVSQLIAALTGASTWRKAKVSVNEKGGGGSKKSVEERQAEANKKAAEKNAKAQAAYDKKIQDAYEKAGAKKDQVDARNAKSLAKYEKQLKKAEEAVKGYLSPIDEINQYNGNEMPEIEPPELEEFDYDEYLQDLLDGIGEFEPIIADQIEDTGAGAAGVVVTYTEEAIDSAIQRIAEKMKEIAQAIAAPIKEAWANVGDFVKKSWKYAMNEVLALTKKVGSDFLKVWQQEETVKIFEDIFKIIGWIGQTIGNLASKFREAWSENDRGLHILETIRDIFGIIISHIEKMAQKTAEWAKEIDFGPLLDSMLNYLKSLEPVIDNVWGIIEDFYTQVLLPLGKWTLEKGLPDLFNVFSDFNNKVDWDSLRTNLSEFWSHLEPFAEKVGEGLIIFINDLASALAEGLNSQEFKDFLTKIGEWMDEVKPEDIASALHTLVKALIALKGAVWAYKGLSAAVSVMSTLGGVLRGLGSIGKGVVNIVGGLGRSLGSLAVGLGRLGKSGLTKVGGGLRSLFSGLGKALKGASMEAELAGAGSFAAQVFLGDMSANLAAGGALAGATAGAAIAGSAIAAIGGYAAGNKIGEALFPDDKELYEKYEGFAGFGQMMIDLWDSIKYLAEEAGTAIADAFGDAVDWVKEKWNAIGEWFSTNVAQPIGQAFDTAVQWIKDAWQGIQDFFQPIADFLSDLWEGVTSRISSFFEGCWIIIQAIWIIVSDWFKNNVIDPIIEKWNGFKEKLAEIWDNAKAKVEEVWNTVKEWFFTTIIEPLQQKWEDFKIKLEEMWNAVKAKIEEIWNAIKEWFFTTIIEPLQQKWEDFKESLSQLWDDVSTKIHEVWDEISTWLQDTIIQPVQDAFSEMCEAVAGFFEDLWDGITKGVKSAFRSVVGVIESAINSIIDGINGFFKGFNWLVEKADAIVHKGWSGVEPIEHVHLDLPGLAKGAVIPPNQEFMAVLGDQKKGTNIETPLATMVEAFNQALAQNGGGNGGSITLNLMLPDKRTIAQYAIEGGQVLQMSRGYNPFLLERG